ncbi:HAMP domain-containing histidine kinase [Mucilaginibacter sp. BJC16-A38]|uniref:sensor histidine kinase n=1 Tax=Mucilaginibacter phenanthrenivorans TaxID=1234842 RepID=UPI0021583CE1|nr:HAMP domain-containing sensor histidine kinase [Mucilaginibacter phenanthrenivorans]MCR8557290.1 HAMP domain-containing histidine kinase [Mucilaginibacter phenanthrenivorans]
MTTQVNYWERNNGSDQFHDEQIKCDLMAVLTHELKSPLSVIKLYVQMMKKLAKRSKDQSTVCLLEKIDIQVMEMASLMDNVLDMSLIFNGKITLRKTCFSIGDLLLEVACDHFQHLETHRLIITVLDEECVYADRGKIKQVVYNLIANAVKYSPDQSEIMIRCQRLTGILTISVSDQGIGISAENQQKLFNRFFRADCQEVTDQKGYGIGLYLVKEIVSHHGGQTWVKSEEGRGASFHFSLPLPQSVVSAYRTSGHG